MDFAQSVAPRILLKIHLSSGELGLEGPVMEGHLPQSAAWIQIQHGSGHHRNDVSAQVRAVVDSCDLQMNRVLKLAYLSIVAFDLLTATHRLLNAAFD